MLFPTATSPGVLTLAALVAVGRAAAATLTVMLTSAESSARIGVARLQVTTRAAPATQLQPVPDALVYAMPTGNVSTSVVTPLVGAEPMFCTTNWYWPGTPTASEPTTRLMSDRLGTAATGIAPVEPESLLAAGSPLACAHARLLRLLPAAAPMTACSTTEAVSVAMSGAARAHVTTDPVAEQAKVDGCALTKVSAAGRVSVRVITPVVGPDPTFVTLSRNLAVSPST